MARIAPKALGASVKRVKSVVRHPSDNSGGVSESGTVVPRSKTLRAQGRPAIYRRPSFASLVPACQYKLHHAI